MKIYVHINSSENKGVFSGIKFSDFIEHSPILPKNLLLLAPLYYGRNHNSGFGILEGSDEIEVFKNHNIDQCGNLCFVDFDDPVKLNSITKLQIAELLYLNHTSEPLCLPFFENIQNRLAYISHDDGWYSKIYCKDWCSMTEMVTNKLQQLIQKKLEVNSFYLPSDFLGDVSNISSKGLLIELESPNKNSNIVVANLIEVGIYENMDVLFNDFERGRIRFPFKKEYIFGATDRQ